MIQKKQLIELSIIVNQMINDIKLAKTSQINNQSVKSSDGIEKNIFQTDYQGQGKIFKEEKDEKQNLIYEEQDNNDQIQNEKRYKIYSVDFKKKLINQIKQEAEQTKKSLYSIFKIKALKYDIHIKNITRWYNLKEIKQRQGGRKAAYPQIEQRLIQFIKNNPKSKRRTIVDQAKKYLAQLNSKNSSNNQFNFSKGWYERFKARYMRKEGVEKLQGQEHIKKQENLNQLLSSQNNDNIKKQQE